MAPLISRFGVTQGFNQPPAPSSQTRQRGWVLNHKDQSCIHRELLWDNEIPKDPVFGEQSKQRDSFTPCLHRLYTAFTPPLHHVYTTFTPRLHRLYTGILSLASRGIRSLCWTQLNHLWRHFFSLITDHWIVHKLYLRIGFCCWEME